MAFWRAPWDSIFARPASLPADDFLLIDTADATSEFGVQSLPSHAFDPLYSPESIHSRSFSVHSCPAPDQLRKAHYQSLVDSRLDSADTTLARRDANALENAGRRNNGHDFQDMRSAAKSQRRRRIDAEKYYGYRAIKPGQFGALHKVAPARTLAFEPAPLVKDWPVQVIGKRELYQQAQLYPRPPTYSRRSHTKDRWPWSMQYEARMAARKHAHDHMEHQEWYPDWERLPLDLHEAMDHDEWLEDQRQAYYAAQAETHRKQTRATFSLKPDRRLLTQRQRLKQQT